MYDYERIDDLQVAGLKIIQDTRGFCYGLDAVLLADFAKSASSHATLDLCSGNGIVALLLAGKTETAKIIGLEIQTGAVHMAQRSIALNGLKGRVEMVCGDVKNAVQLFDKASFDAVTCNPPYMPGGCGLLNGTDAKAVARHEILCTLEDIVVAANQLLSPGGKLFIVHRPQRLVDLLTLMREYHIEPKRLRMVHPTAQKRANLVLVEGARQGGRELKMLPPLYVHDKNGAYTEEIHQIYGWGR